MNFSDSEIVASILLGEGFRLTDVISEAGILLVNTCSVRGHAEQRVLKRLQHFRAYRKKNPGLVIGLLGCMADRIKTSLTEEQNLLDVIAGPDSYRDLPKLLKQVESGQRGVNTLLSLEETYADITPVRLAGNGVTAFISIMRGCENHCSYCVVPAARGQERSRDPGSIVREASSLFSQGYREVTLLGQNVNSYLCKEREGDLRFSGILGRVASIDSRLRVRFATSHPRDLTDDILEIIARHPNICRAIHLPVQSGSDRVLDRMNRNYTRQAYLNRISAIRALIPGCTISTDIITGFCGETDEDHRLTLSIMDEAAFDYAYTFKYSERPGTLAAETMKDDVPGEVKSRRLNEVIARQQKLSLHSNKQDVGKVFEVLAEGTSHRSDHQWMGRTSGNKVVVFPGECVAPGGYVRIKINRCTSATLLGELSDSSGL